MKLFVLFVGDYADRHIHSVHATFDAAIEVDARVRRDLKSTDKPDIEEHTLDPDLCAECGYEEYFHRKDWGHEFKVCLQINL